MNRRTEFVRQMLAGRNDQPQHSSGWHYRPANVALAKYWGKRDSELNLPVASSLSISLGKLGARTRLAPAEHDSLLIDGVPAAADSAAYRRMSSWLDLFRSGCCPGFTVETENTVPMAAGLASSASGFAALTAALNALFRWQLPLREQSILARLGSGSACRSLTSGFVHWHAGSAPDGGDSWGEPLAVSWHELRVAVLPIHTGPKAVSSREGMAHTIATSPLYAAWPAQAERDAEAMRRAVESADFERLGSLAEANAMMMHATMHAARPPLSYWLPESVAAMCRVEQLRREGVAVYFTMDAGPNLKLLYTEPTEQAICEQFTTACRINPFGDSNL